MKKDLPNDFPYQMLIKGFAILKVTIRNGSDEEWSFNLDETRVFSKKGKRIERALPTEITPKIVELYTRTSKGIHTEGYAGGRPTTYEMSRAPTVQSAPGVRTVSAGIGQEIRELVESFEIRDAVIQPGESITGYYFLKSKESGKKLSGGRFQAGTLEAVF